MPGILRRRVYTTVTLTLKLVGKPSTRGLLTAYAHACAASGELASSWCALTDATGLQVGSASGVFALFCGPQRHLPRIDPSRPLAELQVADSTAPESHELTIPGRLAELPPQELSYQELLGIDILKVGGGCDGVFEIGPHLWNLSRYLHGGAVVGAAAETAVHALGPWRVAEAHCQFMSGAARGRVFIQARTLRAGRRVGFVAVEAFLESGLRLATCLCTLVPDSAR